MFALLVAFDLFGKGKPLLPDIIVAAANVGIVGALCQFETLSRFRPTFFSLRHRYTRVAALFSTLMVTAWFPKPISATFLLHPRKSAPGQPVVFIGLSVGWSPWPLTRNSAAKQPSTNTEYDDGTNGDDKDRGPTRSVYRRPTRNRAQLARGELRPNLIRP